MVSLAHTQCETLVDKGFPTTGLLAQVLVTKYQDNLPLYRQEGIFGRAGLAIPQSTLAQWVGQMGVQLQPLVDALKEELLAFPVLHADETPVAMLDPGAGKTHRAYLWSYSICAHDPVRAVIYDFSESRAGKHAQESLATGAAPSSATTTRATRHWDGRSGLPGPRPAQVLRA